MKSVAVSKVAVLLWLVLASMGSRADAENTIGEIVVVGNRTMSTEAIITLSGHRVGDVCTKQSLRDMHDRLARTGNFGMHHPDMKEHWVKIQAVNSGDGKCSVTITVDENERISSVTITGTGPIEPDAVYKRVHVGPVYNFEDMARLRFAIEDFYREAGYQIEYDENIGMDPHKPGALIIPIVAARVDNIQIEGSDPKLNVRILKKLKTKKGDYFNRKTFYQIDQPAVAHIKRGSEVSGSDTPVGKGRIKLTLTVHPK